MCFPLQQPKETHDFRFRVRLTHFLLGLLDDVRHKPVVVPLNVRTDEPGRRVVLEHLCDDANPFLVVVGCNVNELLKFVA